MSDILEGLTVILNTVGYKSYEQTEVTCQWDTDRCNLKEQYKAEVKQHRGKLLVTYWMYNGLTTLGRVKCLNPLTSKWLMKKLRRLKSPDTDKFPEELTEAGGRTVHSELHKPINCMWNMEKIPHQWQESITVPISKQGNKTDSGNYSGISLLSITYKKFYTTPFL